jgi:hypothetical protein
MGHPPAPSAPQDETENAKSLNNLEIPDGCQGAERFQGAERHLDPADQYPTRASRRAAYNAWDQEYLDWQAAGCPGGPDAWPRPPAGLTSAIASRLIPRSRSERKWR